MNQQNESFDEIANALRQLSLDQLSRHKLLALAISRRVLPSSNKAEGQKRLLDNIRREAVTHSLIEEIGKKISRNEFAVGLLKGSALWGDLYRPGEREASDLDLYVTKDKQSLLTEILCEIGFDQVNEKSSRISGFKKLFLSETFGDLSVEVHTRLWWREPENFAWQWRPALRTPFVRLSLEDQLIHLCGHWISQHTMISLHWLFDILLFLKKYEHALDKTKLHNRAKELKLRRSVEIAFELNKRITSGDGFSGLKNYFVDADFLINPTSNRLKYFWMKHSVQDSFSTALIYDFHWLKKALNV